MDSLFAKPPLSVHRKAVGLHTTYTEAALWLQSDDPTAVAALTCVRENNCVLFLQLGGTREVMCCAPCADAPQGICLSTRPTGKTRGKVGTATLIMYG